MGLYIFSLYCMIKGMITSGLILEIISGMVLFKFLRTVMVSVKQNDLDVHLIRKSSKKRTAN